MENNKKKISVISVIVIIVLLLLVATAIVYYMIEVKPKNGDLGNTNTAGVRNETSMTNNLSNNQSVNNIGNNVGNNVVQNTTTTPQEQTKYTLTKEEYPKVDGATAMRPMSVEIAKAVLGMTDSEADKFIVHNTTSKAYQNLIDGKADLIFVSEPSDDILNTAKSKNVEFEMVGIGRDGFVFVVNKENPVKSLTIDQVQKIYTGEIKNWQEVGGANAEILAYQREKNSGSQNLMEKMVMKGLTMTDAPTYLYINDMQGLLDNIASYSNGENSIGYSIYLYAKEQYVKDNIRFLAINGVYPTDETIANGTYPLSKIVYAVYRKDEPANSKVRELVNWLKTTDGQKAVEAGGYVGLK